MKFWLVRGGKYGERDNEVLDSGQLLPGGGALTDGFAVIVARASANSTSQFVPGPEDRMETSG